jgi:hypothetical protein
MPFSIAFHVLWRPLRAGFILSLLPLAGLCVAGAAETWGTVRRVAANSPATIQNAIDTLPESGGKIVIAGDGEPVTLKKSLVIDRDNVTLEGEGRVEFKLADGANAPLLILGQKRAQPNVTRTNIHVRNLRFNGNRRKQTSELNAAVEALRNNGVSLRRVADCSVENVVAFGCRSGGLVTELGCERIAVRNFEGYDNEFDGLACYQTTNSVFAGLKLHGNQAAGISLDLDFAHNVVSNALVTSNLTVGVFIRDSRFNTFQDVRVEDSAHHGVFLAQADLDAETAATDNRFIACVVRNSAGAGIRLNDTNCVRNATVSCVIEKNAGGNISEAAPGLLQGVLGGSE